MNSAEDWLFLHGWGMNAGVWTPFVRGLGADIRPHALDLPGHGGAPLPAADGLQGWTDHVLARAPARATWVGWSLGGLLALDAALRAPERLHRLVLMAATPRFLEAPDWPCGIARGTLGTFHRALLDDPRGTLHRFLVLQLRGGEGMRHSLRLLEAEINRHPPPRPEALAAGLELLRSGDLRARLTELGIPSLWLFGARDTLVPAATAACLRALLPTAEIRTVPGAAHAPFLSHPDPLRQALAGFRSTHP